MNSLKSRIRGNAMEDLKTVAIIFGLVATFIGMIALIIRTKNTSKDRNDKSLKIKIDSSCAEKQLPIIKQLEKGSANMALLKAENEAQSRAIDRIENHVETIRNKPVNNGEFLKLTENVEKIIQYINSPPSPVDVPASAGSFRK